MPQVRELSNQCDYNQNCDQQIEKYYHQASTLLMINRFHSQHKPNLV